MKITRRFSRETFHEDLMSSAQVVSVIRDMKLTYVIERSWAEQRDYSNVSGHVTRNASATTTTVADSPAVIGADGGSNDGSGGDGAGEDGGEDGGGDGEPPAFGPTALAVLAALLLLLPHIDLDWLRAPQWPPLLLASATLYARLPTLPQFLKHARYLFPDRLRADVYLPHARALLRELRKARSMPVNARRWVGLCLRARAALLVAKCLSLSWNELGRRAGE
jgi:hypothetical protein